MTRDLLSIRPFILVTTNYHVFIIKLANAMVAYWTGNKRSWFAALERLLTSSAVVCELGGRCRGPGWVFSVTIEQRFADWTS